jgi:hypothetical protein
MLVKNFVKHIHSERRCSLIVAAIFDGPDQYNNCVEPVGTNTCADCIGSSCTNMTIVQDTGAILSKNLTFMSGEVYHFAKCATEPFSYPDYVYSCFTTEDKQLTFSQVSPVGNKATSWAFCNKSFREFNQRCGQELIVWRTISSMFRSF